MTQQFLQLFSFHRFRQTVGHKAFQTRFFPIKEKLTFRLLSGKIIFRTRAIWVGIFWHGTQGKKWSGKRRKHLTPHHFYQTLSFSQLYMVVCIFEKIPGGHCNWKSAVHKRPLFASLVISCFGTWFENHRKSLIQHCERSELTFFSEQKFIKTGQFGKFLKTKARGQTVLPDK